MEATPEQRLEKAKGVFRKLTARLIAAEKAKLDAEQVIAWSLATLNGDQMAGNDPPAGGHPLLAAAAEASQLLASHPHPRVKAGRRLDILRRVSRTWPENLAEVRARMQAIGANTEWLRLLSEIRSEIQTEESP